MRVLTEIPEFVVKLQERGDVPVGILYYSMKKDCIILAPFSEVTPQEVNDLLSKFGLLFEVNGK